jgi:hypothetical protein
MVSDNLKAAGLSLVFGTAGDVFSRMMWFNCSIDKFWTTLFVLPPMSIVTAIMYFMGKIEKANLPCVSAIDWFLLMIPVLGISFTFLLSKMIENGNIITALTLISMMVLFMMVRMYKYNTMCKVHFPDTNTGFNSNYIVRAGLISVAINMVIFIINMMAPYLQMIPVIGMAFRLWGMLKIIPGAQHVLPLTFAHLIMNLYDNLPSNLESTCIKKIT